MDAGCTLSLIHILQYELGGPFAALKPTGVGNVADVSFSYPIIRQRSTNLFLRGVLDLSLIHI